HYGEAHGVRVGDGPRGQALEPAEGLLVIAGSREMEIQARAGVHALESTHGRLQSGAKQGESVNLRDYEVCRDERQSLPYRLAKEAVGLGVMLITPAAQGNPGAAIDEQSSGCAGARGTV